MDLRKISIASTREVRNGRGRRITTRVLYYAAVYPPPIEIGYQRVYTTTCDAREEDVDASTVSRTRKHQAIDMDQFTIPLQDGMTWCTQPPPPSSANFEWSFVERFRWSDDEDPHFWPQCRESLRLEVMAYEALKRYNHPTIMKYHGVATHYFDPDRVVGVFLERKDLQHCPDLVTLADRKTTSAAEWCQIYGTLLDGIRLLHSLNLVLNSLFPDCITLTPRGPVFMELGYCMPVGHSMALVHADRPYLFNKDLHRVATFENDYYRMGSLWQFIGREVPKFRGEWNRTYGGPPFPGL
ncbi:hypothetical protein PLICRDRAFT_30853 [Plicaturopsis crispa FD-325 SS-3]|nr:hypothetical protein PLICRDRAFT_30853 [Plicaturopsis crispa FD-325 SS-3]